MAFYWIKTHPIIQMLFPRYLWRMSPNFPNVYLTFDDGPEPEVTPWVLDKLKEYNAKATFFCIGKNIETNPELFRRIINEGHAIGNHTANHLNGWSTDSAAYLKNAESFENSARDVAAVEVKLFRPPYGKIKLSQAKALIMRGYKIVMWDVLSADFDRSITPEKCAQNVLRNIGPGSIVIFHDSKKAKKNMQVALLETLQYAKRKGYKCEVIA